MLCAAVQIIPQEAEWKGEQKTKHVPVERVKDISQKMMRVSYLRWISKDSELSCYHSKLSAPYYLEDQWRLD